MIAPAIEINHRAGREDVIDVTTRPGGWFSPVLPPKIEGYQCTFVAHYGTDRTVHTYRRKSE